MRIWSIHPKYLDSKGLVALWRETLLAKNVLQNNTVGYKNHPQLERFKNHQKPVEALDYYLSVVHQESINRGYKFDELKFEKVKKPKSIDVTSGQVRYETKHLVKKLVVRNSARHLELKQTIELDLHPLFNKVKGEVESWEKII